MSGIYRGPGGGTVGATPGQVAAIAAAVASAEQAAEDAGASAVVAQRAATYALQTWAITQAFTATSATRNSDGALTSANIVWPDGTSGVFTADVLSTLFPGAIDAWHATYLGSSSLTATQPQVTRDSNGAVTAQPAIVIT